MATAKMKLTPDDLKALRDDIDALSHDHRDVLNAEPRISRPLNDALQAAKIRFEDIDSSKRVM